jgi:alkanesulfonate monooxygenase SsuD/methylene tetrahydromethanopterin reductase-like flavin-dependent oxidoreductase (luciferase family)
MQGKYQEAERVLRDALAIERPALGNDHPRVGVSLVFLADSLCRAGKASEAERAAREALTINNTRLGKDHPRTKESEGTLGCAMAKQRRFAEAEPLLLSYFAALQANTSVEGDPSEVAARIAELYAAWSKVDKAAEWRKTLTKIAAEKSP